MAKNFEQYDDSPVMSYLSKAKEEVKLASDANQILKSAAENPASEQSETRTDAPSIQSENQENIAGQTQETTRKTEAEQTSQIVPEPKKILMNISIRETTKKDWKMFFLEHDLSMTQGIETAVEFLKSEVEKGNIRLSKGGITK